MKRIISVLLVAVMLLLLASCQPAGVDLAKYQAAIEATEPTAARVTVSLTSAVYEGVELGSEYAITFNDDGSASVEFTYDVLNDSGTGSTDFKSTVPGSATIASDGTVTGDSVPASVASGAKLAIKLDQSKFKSMIEARGILTVEVLAANTEAVLGFKVDADVSFELRITEDGKIGSASLNYTDAAGATAIVVTYE